MVLGSVVRGHRVTELLAEKVTPLDHTQGFGANLVTASLVTAGAVFGLPMSTTHVSSGAIFGIAASRDPSALNRETARAMLLAWIATLPGAAALGVGAYALAGLFG
jgi:PiT family inorganic phosphate transporter